MPIRPTLVLSTLLSLFAWPAWADYRETVVEHGGTVAGKVVFEGALPDGAVERFPIPHKSLGCGLGYRDVVHIDVKDGALRGVFVLIEGVAAGKPWPKAEAPVLLDQKDCRFTPDLQIVRRGAPMVVRNSDAKVLHNVNLREVSQVSSGRTVRRMLFNIAQPDLGEVEKKVKPKKSPFLTVGCDIHNFMVAHVVAPEHPYAAVVADDGSFTIGDVPPGRYTVVAWHPTLGEKRTEVVVGKDAKAEVRFEYGP